MPLQSDARLRPRARQCKPAALRANNKSTARVPSSAWEHAGDMSESAAMRRDAGAAAELGRSLRAPSSLVVLSMHLIQGQHGSEHSTRQESFNQFRFY